MIIDLNSLEPMNILPQDIQERWRAALEPTTPTPGEEGGAFRLIFVRPTDALSWEGQRLIVLVVDENGTPMPGVKVAFSFSTAKPYVVSQDFKWSPPQPRKADVFPTRGSGEIERRRAWRDHSIHP
jgi:hypothetical protein